VSYQPPSKAELHALRLAACVTDVSQGLIGLATLGFFKPSLSMDLIEAHARWYFARAKKGG
jgi:hypothetical protein